MLYSVDRSAHLTLTPASQYLPHSAADSVTCRSRCTALGHCHRVLRGGFDRVMCRLRSAHQPCRFLTAWLGAEEEAEVVRDDKQVNYLTDPNEPQTNRQNIFSPSLHWCTWATKSLSPHHLAQATAGRRAVEGSLLRRTHHNPIRLYSGPTRRYPHQTPQFPCTLPPVHEARSSLSNRKVELYPQDVRMNLPNGSWNHKQVLWGWEEEAERREEVLDVRV